MSKVLEHLLHLEKTWTREKADIVDWNILSTLRDATAEERLAESEEITCIVCRLSLPRSLAFLIKNREIHEESLEECFLMVRDRQDYVECTEDFDKDPCAPSNPEVIARAKHIFYLLKKGRFPSVYNRAMHLPPSLSFSTREEALAFFVNAPRDDVAEMMNHSNLNHLPNLWTYLLQRPEVGRWMLDAYQTDFVDERDQQTRLLPDIGARLACSYPQALLMARSFEGAAAGLAFLGMFCGIDSDIQEKDDKILSKFNKAAKIQKKKKPTGGYILTKEVVANLVDVQMPLALKAAAKDAEKTQRILAEFDEKAALLDEVDMEIVGQRVKLALRVGESFAGVVAMELFLMGAETANGEEELGEEGHKAVVEMQMRLGGAKWDQETLALREKFASAMRMAAFEILKKVDGKAEQKKAKVEEEGDIFEEMERVDRERRRIEKEEAELRALRGEDDDDVDEDPLALNGRDIGRGQGRLGAYRDTFDEPWNADGEESFYDWRNWLVDYEELDDSSSEDEDSDDDEEDDE